MKDRMFQFPASWGQMMSMADDAKLGMFIREVWRYRTTGEESEQTAQLSDDVRKFLDAEIEKEHRVSAARANAATIRWQGEKLEKQPKKVRRKKSVPKSISEKEEPEPVVIPADMFAMLPLRGGGSYPLTESELSKFAEAYPAVDVHQEARSACSWLEHHKERQKTESGILVYLDSWFRRCQERGGTSGFLVEEKQPKYKDPFGDMIEMEFGKQ